MSTVRIAKPEDYMGIWRLVLQGHRESGMFNLAPEKIDWWLKRILAPDTIAPTDTGPRGVIGVIGRLGQPEGMAFLVFGQYWYSNEMHLEEFMVCVEHEHRKENHAKSLISWMKEQSEATGLPLVTGVMSNYRTEAKVRLYQRMLPKAGAFFLFNPKGSCGSYAVAGSS